jgi:hypothetical protein
MVLWVLLLLSGVLFFSVALKVRGGRKLLILSRFAVEELRPGEELMTFVFGGTGMEFRASCLLGSRFSA